MDRRAKRGFKNELYDRLALVGNALASGRRLELLDLLAQGERSVEALAAETDQPFANVSQHLQVLRRAQLVESRRKGTYVFYRLADDCVLELWISLRRAGEKQLSEIRELVRSFFRDRSELQAISQEELKSRLEDPGLVVLDVRPLPEYEAGHIAGARSIPIPELRSRLRELPRSRKIIAYCRGPHCVFADEAVELLRSKGHRALRLESGFPEWKIRGYPITGGTSTYTTSQRGN
ncbi:MAG TPA: metalloregulator ArsR/SmtB family transcription factor [Bryobacteraceae bacterium]|jgi:rhodanese-related sulfurtransferase